MFTAKQTTKIIGILIMHPDVVPNSKTNHTNILFDFGHIKRVC
jgi:hypothetical protein